MAYTITFMYVQCSYTLSLVWGNNSFVRKQGQIVHRGGKENINKTIKKKNNLKYSIFYLNVCFCRFKMKLYKNKILIEAKTTLKKKEFNKKKLHFNVKYCIFNKNIC